MSLFRTCAFLSAVFMAYVFTQSGLPASFLTFGPNAQFAMLILLWATVTAIIMVIGALLTPLAIVYFDRASTCNVVSLFAVLFVGAFLEQMGIFSYHLVFLLLAAIIVIAAILRGNTHDNASEPAVAAPGVSYPSSSRADGDVGNTDKYLDRGAVYSNRDFERNFDRDYSRSRDGSTMSASEQDAAFDRDYARSRDGDIGGGYGENEGNGEGGGSGGYRD